MGIDNAHYHGWEGTLRSPWWATLAMVRVALLQLFRRKSYWLVIALGLLQFFTFWTVIYVVTQAQLSTSVQRDLFTVFGFSPSPAAGEENGYITFMQRQGSVVMILLAFSGSLLVGADFRLNSLPFYLSRRIDRRHYIVGKLAAISAIVTLMTTLPALLLFFEFGMFTSSVRYWIENWNLAVSVIVFGTVMSIVLSIWLVTLSAYLQKAAPIAITWASIFVMLRLLSSYLRDATGDQYWSLLAPDRDIRLVAKLCFGSFYGIAGVFEKGLAKWAAVILATSCLTCLILLVRRVRAVEIVQ